MEVNRFYKDYFTRTCTRSLSPHFSLTRKRTLLPLQGSCHFNSVQQATEEGRCRGLRCKGDGRRSLRLLCGTGGGGTALTAPLPPLLPRPVGPRALLSSRCLSAENCPLPPLFASHSQPSSQVPLAGRNLLCHAASGSPARSGPRSPSEEGGGGNGREQR